MELLILNQNSEEINDIAELLKIGKELIEKKEFDEGKKFIKKALEKQPEDLNVLNSMGFAHGRAGEFDEAIKWYKKALAIEPNFQKALGNIGHVYEMKGDFTLAVEFYEKSLEAKSDDDSLMFPAEIIPVITEHLQKAKEAAKSGK